MNGLNWAIEKIYIINSELQNSDYLIADLQKALNDLYENFDGYFGIRTEMEEWNLDENGEVIPHNFSETENFYYKISFKIYKILIDKEYKALNNITKTGLEEEYEKGRRYGYRSALLDLKEYSDKMLARH